MISTPFCILASTSVFRRKLLLSTGIKFEVLAPQFNEDLVFGLPNPKELSITRSLGKAQSAASLILDHKQKGTLNTLFPHKNEIDLTYCVIASDQTLDFEGRSIEKADTAAEAFYILQMLNGHTHYFHTSYTLALVGKKIDIVTEKTVTTPIKMRNATRQELVNYMQYEEWRGCVGSCQFEGVGKNLFDPGQEPWEESAIVGLPLISLLDDLRKLGVNPLCPN